MGKAARGQLDILDANQQAIIAYAQQGKTSEELGAMLGHGITAGIVHGYLSRLGVYVSRPKYGKKPLPIVPRPSPANPPMTYDATGATVLPGQLVFPQTPAPRQQPQPSQQSMPNFAPPPQVTAPGAVAQGASSPLFPNTDPNELSHVEIHRRFARPAAAGVGLLGVLDRFATHQTILGLYGGGRYELVGVNLRGERIASAHSAFENYTVPSRPVFVEEESEAEEIDEPTPVYIGMPPLPPNADVNQQLVHQVQVMQQQMAELQQRTLTQQVATMKAMADERISAMQQLMMQQQQQNREFYASQVQLMSAAMGKENVSLLDKIEEHRAMQDLMGGGSGEKADPLTTAISKLPEVLEAAGDLIHGGQADEGEEPTNQGGTDARIISLGEIGAMTVRTLMAKGMPRDQAIAKVKMGLKFLTADLKRKPEAPKPVASTPAPIKAEPQGNGTTKAPE